LLSDMQIRISSPFLLKLAGFNSPHVKAVKANWRLWVKWYARMLQAGCYK